MLTHERLLEVLHYDPATGIFTWLKGQDAGRQAGTRDPRGYIKISIDGRRYYGHRLAWFYVTDRWPDPEADHEDLNKSNNRWANLREATPSQNRCNRRAVRGLKGASLHNSGTGWVSQIKKNGRVHYLGFFETEELAHAAYVRAISQHHGEFGRVK